LKSSELEIIEQSIQLCLSGSITVGFTADILSGGCSSSTASESDGTMRLLGVLSKGGSFGLDQLQLGLCLRIPLLLCDLFFFSGCHCLDG
jgi:hypothetical protein